MDGKLIFDFGFHNGDDTDFYLKKGFKVVAVEANPTLVAMGMERFSDHIASEQLILLNKAVTNSLQKVEFHVNKTIDNWSSCFKSMAQSQGHDIASVIVNSTTTSELIKHYGTPYYLKSDIEGMDPIVAEQIFNQTEKPSFISFEISKTDYAAIFSWLYVAGYREFQLVNQMNICNKHILPNANESEGIAIDYLFGKHSSGLFGNDLADAGWMSYDELLTGYTKYRELKYIDNVNLALGWLDVHARMR